MTNLKPLTITIWPQVSQRSGQSNTRLNLESCWTVKYNRPGMVRLLNIEDDTTRTLAAISDVSNVRNRTELKLALVPTLRSIAVQMLKSELKHTKAAMCTSLRKLNKAGTQKDSTRRSL